MEVDLQVEVLLDEIEILLFLLRQHHLCIWRSKLHHESYVITPILFSYLSKTLLLPLTFTVLYKVFSLSYPTFIALFYTFGVEKLEESAILIRILKHFDQIY
jgi:hypothetical protein